MFHVTCPTENAEVLLGERSIISSHNTSDGIVTYFRCHCGQVGFFVTGRKARRDVDGHLGPVTEPAAVA